ncbi:MAG: hypothetical protein KGL39_27210 [Patescibacteria group bacterium]|nr:hypothetical protein [Patescibacteria group bacterium]
MEGEDDLTLDLFGEPDEDTQGQEDLETQGDGTIAIEVDEEGNPIQAQDGDLPGDEGLEDKDTVKVKRADWDKLNADLAEVRGYMTAKKGVDGERPVVREEQHRQSEQRREQPQDFETQLDLLSDKALDDLMSGDREKAKGAIKNVLKVGAQAGYNNAAALFRQMVPLQAQGIIDRYSARKERSDPMYNDGVGEIFENILSGYDTSMLVGADPKVVKDTLDTMYQRAKGDWADRQYAKSKERKQLREKQGNSTPLNLGGGKATGGTQGRRELKVPEAWKAWIASSGASDEEVNSMLAKMAKGNK